MNISTVTEVTSQAPPLPAAPVAAGDPAGEEGTAPAGLVLVTPDAPPPPPLVGFPQEVLVGIDEATHRRVYDIVDPDSGDSLLQIPAEAVLGLVARILHQLEAEGLR